MSLGDRHSPHRIMSVFGGLRSVAHSMDMSETVEDGGAWGQTRAAVRGVAKGQTRL